MTKQTTALHQLKHLRRKGKKHFKKQFKSAPKEIVRILCEICLNLLNRRLHPNSIVLKSLLAYKHCIRYLAAKGHWKKKLAYILKHIYFVYKLLTPSLLDSVEKNGGSQEIILD
jgi:hypothetical protein